MFYKPRTEPAELLMFGMLGTRMDLPEKEKQYYQNLQKGYEGELMFDTWTEKLQCECYILNDLLLKAGTTTFQIDSLLIASETIYFFEVKNYEGDYYFEGDRFYKRPRLEIVNPLHQLSRSEALLRQLLNSLGYNLPIDASVVFINPEFALFQAPLDKPIILPNQLNRYFQKLNRIQSRLNGKHRLLAERLVALHIQESPFLQLPSYDYGQMKKGITCARCHSFFVSVGKVNCVCKECDYNEPVPSAVLRSVREFQVLFPELKLTTNIIHGWCQGTFSKQRIRRILEKNFKRSGVHQWSFYE
nr:nuclease-related domain-containing protein [Ammoniphilus resinae]